MSVDGKPAAKLFSGLPQEPKPPRKIGIIVRSDLSQARVVVDAFVVRDGIEQRLAVEFVEMWRSGCVLRWTIPSGRVGCGGGGDGGGGATDGGGSGGASDGGGGAEAGSGGGGDGGRPGLAMGTGGHAGTGGEPGTGGRPGVGGGATGGAPSGTGGSAATLPDGGSDAAAADAALVDGGLAGHDAADRDVESCPPDGPPSPTFSCQDYCAVVGQRCAALYPGGDCLATCESFHWRASSGAFVLDNSIECRTRYASMAVDGCRAASPSGGTYCPADRCQVYCDALDTNCAGPLHPIAGGRPECLQACRKFTWRDAALTPTGNTGECFLYWAARAGRSGATDATTACTRAGPGSEACVQ